VFALGVCAIELGVRDVAKCVTLSPARASDALYPLENLVPVSIYLLKDLVPELSTLTLHTVRRHEIGHQLLGQQLLTPERSLLMASVGIGVATPGVLLMSSILGRTFCALVNNVFGLIATQTYLP
jgi:hypothetical protein